MITVKDLTGSDAPEGAADYRKKGVYVFQQEGLPALNVRTNDQGLIGVSIEWMLQNLQEQGYDQVTFHPRYPDPDIPAVEVA
jgi:hypothetical protein